MENIYLNALNKMKADDERTSIGTNLRKLRESKGISARDIPDLLEKHGFKIKYSTYMGYENNNSIPNADLFLALCSIFQVADVLQSFGYGEDIFPSFNSAILMDLPYFNLIEDYCNNVIGLNTSKKVFDYFFAPGSEANIRSVFIEGKPNLKDELEIARILGISSHSEIYKWGEIRGIWESPLSFPILSDEEKHMIITSRQLKAERENSISSAG